MRLAACSFPARCLAPERPGRGCRSADGAHGARPRPPSAGPSDLRRGTTGSGAGGHRSPLPLHTHRPLRPTSPLRRAAGSQTPCSELSRGFQHTRNKNQTTEWPTRPQTSLASPIPPLASGFRLVRPQASHWPCHAALRLRVCLLGVVLCDGLPQPRLSGSDRSSSLLLVPVRHQHLCAEPEGAARLTPRAPDSA